MREVAREQQPQLGENQAAKGKEPLFAALAEDAEDAALGVKVTNLDTGELGAT